MLAPEFKIPDVKLFSNEYIKLHNCQNLIHDVHYEYADSVVQNISGEGRKILEAQNPYFMTNPVPENSIKLTQNEKYSLGLRAKGDIYEDAESPE